VEGAIRSRSSVGIAIVNWNAGAHLQECVASIAATAWTEVSLAVVVIVDNASADGSADRLTYPEWLPVRVVRNGENRGFAAACNQAAALIDADVILFLNPDAVLQASSVPAAACWLADPAHAFAGVVGIQLVDEHERVTRSCARFPTPTTMINKTLGLSRLAPRLFASYLMEDWDHAESREVDHVIGAFYCVRSAMFRTLGGFDESFFVYFEDLDFSRRARAAGWRTFYLSTARAYHKGGGSSEQIKSTRLFYSLRSRLLYARKHFSRPAALAVTFCTLVLEPLVRLGACLIGGSPTGVRETLNAYRMLWTAPGSAW
jgi:N-acetylglucosaminyl-diphospho-decaprenol L-rhamnosyltransferase